MLINWLKHNFKSSNKTILSLNKELREVKDKELLQKLYESCIERQLPVSELFSGVIFTGAATENGSSQDKDYTEAAKIQYDVENAIKQEEKSTNSSIACEQSIVANNLVEIDSGIFIDLETDSSAPAECGIEEEDLTEELELMDYEEEDSCESGEWTTIVSWSFAEEVETKEGTALGFGESNFSNDVFVKNTA